ncbi:glycosyltransferase [Clostridiaceae bacterium DONG20-135]|uniref:Glycosyltransferase n=1 Tax=Copranaerobaculum intestinale TaxID=2692629 RepID=A0A6N8U880_9FIRM|nr:glycosyltransferase family 4 protein [Copranaerobaculum intestinale]MXQ72769.1 glycosyltransferase [Copranaerobaculum intestinale]
MNILIIENTADSLWKIRGNLFLRLLKLGANITICGPEIYHQKIYEYDEHGIKYFHLDADSQNINPFKEIKSLIRIRRQLLNLKPDAVIVIGMKFIPTCILASRFAKVPYLFSYINGVGNLFIQNTMKFKIVRFISFPMLKFAFFSSDLVFLQNQDDIDELINRHLLSQEKTVLTDGSGVDMERYQPTPYPDQITFTYIGRICSEKGILEFLEAAEIIKEVYPHIRFIVVGNIYRVDDIGFGEKKRCLLKNGIFEYYEAVEDVNEILDKTSVVVMPSYREGLSRVVIEGMAKKRPAIVSDVPGNRSAVEHKVNGLRIPVQDAKSLAIAMKYFIENEESIAIMGLKGYELCKSKFEVNKVNEKMVKKLWEVMNK